jgi:hypothetical protein
MNGSNTQADPLQITDSAELKEFAGLGGFGQFMNDIDGTDDPNFSLAFTQPTTSLNFNSFKLKNTTTTGNYFLSIPETSAVTLNDVNIENCQLSSSTSFINPTTQITTRKHIAITGAKGNPAIIDIKINGNITKSIDLNRITGINYAKISVSCTGALTVPLFKDTSLNNCYLLLDIPSVQKYSNDVDFALFYNTDEYNRTFKNVKIEGEIDASSITGKGFLLYGPINNYFPFTIDSAFFNATLTVGAGTVLANQGRRQGVFILNSDKISVSAASLGYALSDAECKDISTFKEYSYDISKYFGRELSTAWGSNKVDYPFLVGIEDYPSIYIRDIISIMKTAELTAIWR